MNKNNSWKNLSDEAKGIIEWVVSPFTNFKQTIEIKIGGVFQRKCPELCGDFGEPLGDVNILITKELFQEVSKYVVEQEDMEYKQSDGSLAFRLKDSVEV